MHESLKKLLAYTAKNVTDDILSRYVTSDPGWQDYVRELKCVRDSVMIPYPATFDIREPIELARWGVASEYKRPQEFLKFRSFTSAIALCIIEKDLEAKVSSDGTIYFILNILTDADPMNQNYMTLLLDVFKYLYSLMSQPLDGDLAEFQFQDGDCSLMSFASFYLHQLMSDWEQSEKFASQLVADLEKDSSATYPFCADDLIDSQIPYTKVIARNLKNPSQHADVEKIIEIISSSSHR